MASKLKLVRRGVARLLKSETVGYICTLMAENVAERCGEGWKVAEPHKTGQRVAVNVYPATREAARDNAENDTARRVIQSMEILL